MILRAHSFTSMVFFAGPRACVGFKFAIYEISACLPPTFPHLLIQLMELELVISTLLTEFEFRPGNRPSTWDLSVVLMPVLDDEPERSPGLYLHVKRVTN